MTDDLRVAIVGAGPAGMFLADALLFQKNQPVRVDLYDRLPTPFGLIRYGVAPDHLKMKSLTRSLQRTLDDERLRFFGHVDIGHELTVEELRASYHAVAYTFGASTDRRLDVPGEDVAGSRSATDFVAWYSGHPDMPADAFDLSVVRSAVVVGVGNVAVDVSRVLSKHVDALRLTDMPEAVLERLDTSAVTDVHVLGRRGPLQAKFTAKELHELGELDGVDVIVDPVQLERGVDSMAEQDITPALSRNLQILRGWAERGPRGADRRLHLHFWSRPVAVEGTRRIEAVNVEPTRLNGDLLVADGEPWRLPAQLLLRAVGYRGIPIPGVPLHEGQGTVPHTDGRVLRDGVTSFGEYVAGWIGRGPVGLLGTNRSDAEGVAERLLADAPILRARDLTGPDPIELLRQRNTTTVDCHGWAAIDTAEVDLGRSRGRARTKLATWPELLGVGAETPVG